MTLAMEAFLLHGDTDLETVAALEYSTFAHDG